MSENTARLINRWNNAERIEDVDARTRILKNVLKDMWKNYLEERYGYGR